MTDHRQVVGDEHIAEPQLILKVEKEVENLRLHRKVERGDRLVAYDQRGLQRQGAGDPDPLPLTTGELRRQPPRQRRVHADLGEQLLGSWPAVLRSMDAVDIRKARPRSATPAAGGRATNTGPGRSSGGGVGSGASRSPPANTGPARGSWWYRHRARAAGPAVSPWWSSPTPTRRLERGSHPRAPPDRPPRPP